jgi:hypothetical protein
MIGCAVLFCSFASDLASASNCHSSLASTESDDHANPYSCVIFDHVLKAAQPIELNASGESLAEANVDAAASAQRESAVREPSNPAVPRCASDQRMREDVDLVAPPGESWSD